MISCRLTESRKCAMKVRCATGTFSLLFQGNDDADDDDADGNDGNDGNGNAE